MIILGLILKIYWNIMFFTIEPSISTQQPTQKDTAVKSTETIHTISEQTSTLDLPNTNLQIILPFTYSLTKDTQSAAVWTSIASYFNNNEEARMSPGYKVSAVRVTDESFLKKAVEKIKPTYGGDGSINPSVDLNEYYKIKKYFNNEIPLEKDFTQKIFNENTWFISKSHGGELANRKYQTMFGDKLVTIFVSESWFDKPGTFSPEKADELFSRIEVKVKK